MYGGIEAGGTKWVCAIGTGAGEVLDEVRFPTTTPDETIGRALEFFRRYKHELRAVGVGSFGPVDLHPTSPTYGYITTTPKPGWQFTDVVGPLRRALGVPVGFETDVNAAALGEHRWGAARGLENFVYLTVGTGIGGGAMVNGKLLHGVLHPEMGHMLLPRHLARESAFAGICPFHGHCLEGLASGPAIEARWGARAETLPTDHPAWKLEAHYLALGLVNIICVLSPERIIMGGGVMHQPQVFTHLHAELKRLLNDYLRLPQLTERIEEYIVAPGLRDRAGVLGATALAELAASGRVVNNPFVGTWRLVTAEYQRDGKVLAYPFGPNPVGLLMYDAAGNMSVQLIQPNRATLADVGARERAEDEGRAAFDGYLGYYGTYEILPHDQIIIHRLTGSSLLHWIGTEQVRRYDFSGNCLTLSAQATRDKSGAVAVLVWERMG